MFAKHNLAQWSEPPEFVFEPSPIWHEDPEIITDEYAKVFLRNMVTKSREGLQRVQGPITLKHQEVDKLRASVEGKENTEAVSNVSPISALGSVKEANGSNYWIP